MHDLNYHSAGPLHDNYTGIQQLPVVQNHNNIKSLIPWEKQTVCYACCVGFDRVSCAN